MANEDYFAIWIVEHKKPGEAADYSARRWVMNEGEGVLRPTGELLLADNLLQLQNQFKSKDLIRLERDVSDPPGFIESWV